MFRAPPEAEEALIEAEEGGSRARRPGKARGKLLISDRQAPAYAVRHPRLELTWACAVCWLVSMAGKECTAGDGGRNNAQGVLAQKRGLQQPARGSAQKKGSVKGKTLAVPISKALRGERGQGRGAGRRGRGGRASAGGRGQLTEQNWNPASLKITIKNDRVCAFCAKSAQPLIILL